MPINYLQPFKASDPPGTVKDYSSGQVAFGWKKEQKYDAQTTPTRKDRCRFSCLLTSNVGVSEATPSLWFLWQRLLNRIPVGENWLLISFPYNNIRCCSNKTHTNRFQSGFNLFHIMRIF